MRITNNMMITNMMQNLNKNMLRLDKRQMQAATGKRIHVPSDDPVAISRSLKLRADIGELAQYKKNVDDAVSFLETTEMAVKNVGDALIRLRELTGQAANGVLTQEDTIKVQSEVKELKEQIIMLGNTTYSGKYIFSGKKTNEPLFDSNGNYLLQLDDYKNPSIPDDRIRFEVGTKETIEINTLGFDIFEINSSVGNVNAEWSTGAITPLAVMGDSETITFMGATVTLEIDATNTMVVDDNRSATVTSNSLIASDQAQALAAAFNGIAAEAGSPLAGFTFTAVGDELRVIAPNGSGHVHNHQRFTTSAGLIIANTGAAQLTEDGVSEGRNVSGGQAGIIAMIEAIETKLAAGDTAGLTADLDNIDAYINVNLAARAEIGAKSNRMELVQNRITDDNVNFNQLLSSLEDADMAEVIMNLLNEENVYRASLSVGARVIQPSLLDFLR